MNAMLRRAASACAVVAALALLVAQCGAPASSSRESRKAALAGASSAEAARAAWETIYAVLQHPRCVNCHPAGSAPLVGDERRPHPQNVQGGPEGKGVFAMRCASCHQDANLAGAHLPPGAPNWHLPHPSEPLIFEGKSSAELCRQLRDPAHNGGRTPEEVLTHLAHDPLVLWGWDPGEGRAPVGVGHGELLRAAQAWVDGGCDCPQ